MEKNLDSKKVADILKNLTKKTKSTKNTLEKPKESLIIPSVHKDKDQKPVWTDIDIPEEMQASKEWTEKMMVWFKQYHDQVEELKLQYFLNNNSIASVTVRRSIECGENPLIGDIYDNTTAWKILKYISKTNQKYNKSDLMWIFSACANTNKEIKQSMMKVYQEILSKIAKEISRITKENELYPYLMIVYIIITKYYQIVI